MTTEQNQDPSVPNIISVPPLSGATASDADVQSCISAAPPQPLVTVTATGDAVKEPVSTPRPTALVASMQPDLMIYRNITKVPITLPEIGLCIAAGSTYQVLKDFNLPDSAKKLIGTALILQDGACAANDAPDAAILTAAPKDESSSADAVSKPKYQKGSGKLANTETVTVIPFDKKAITEGFKGSEKSGTINQYLNRVQGGIGMTPTDLADAEVAQPAPDDARLLIAKNRKEWLQEKSIDQHIADKTQEIAKLVPPAPPMPAAAPILPVNSDAKITEWFTKTIAGKKIAAVRETDINFLTKLVEVENDQNVLKFIDVRLQELSHNA